MMNKGLNTVTLDTLYASGIQLAEEQYTFEELINYARELATDKMVVADVEKELYFIELVAYCSLLPLNCNLSPEFTVIVGADEPVLDAM